MAAEGGALPEAAAGGAATGGEGVSPGLAPLSDAAAHHEPGGEFALGENDGTEDQFSALMEQQGVSTHPPEPARRVSARPRAGPAARLSSGDMHGPGMGLASRARPS